MSKIEVDTIEPQSGTSLTLGASGDTITIPSGATLTNSGTATGFGKVLQVVQTVKTDTTSVTGTTFTDITGLTVSITPSSASNKILIMISMTFGGNGDIYPACKLFRDSTNIVIATDLQGSCIAASFGKNAFYTTNTENLNYTFLDSPSSTSSITYKIQVRPMGTTSKIFYLNRPHNTSDANRYQGTSTITAVEIAG